MSQSISRAFPGGPGKRAEVPVQTVSERVKRVEEIEDRVAERRRYLNRRARWYQLKAVLVASAVAAAGAGLYLGLVRGPDANGTDAVETGSMTSNP